MNAETQPLTESQADSAVAREAKVVAEKEAAAAAAGVGSEGSPAYLRPKGYLKQGSKATNQLESESVCDTKPGSYEKAVRVKCEPSPSPPRSRTPKHEAQVKKELPPVAVKREPVDDLRVSRRGTAPASRDPPPEKKPYEVPSDSTKNPLDVQPQPTQKKPKSLEPVQEEKPHAPEATQQKRKSPEPILGEKVQDVQRKPTQKKPKSVEPAPEEKPPSHEDKPSLVASAGVVSPSQQNSIGQKGQAVKGRSKKDDKEEVAPKRKPGRPKKSEADDKGGSNKQSKSKTKNDKIEADKKDSTAKATKKRKQDLEEEDCSEATQHYTPNKAKSPTGKACKKDNASSETNKKKSKTTKPKAKPTKKRKKGEDDAETQRKALLSRKSCAYKKAKNEALKAGASQEQACDAGKKAPCFEMIELTAHVLNIWKAS